MVCPRVINSRFITPQTERDKKDRCGSGQEHPMEERIDSGQCVHRSSSRFPHGGVLRGRSIVYLIARFCMACNVPLSTRASTTAAHTLLSIPPVARPAPHLLSSLRAKHTSAAPS